VALALNPDGEKDVLGLWIEQSEGAKFWLKVINELKARRQRHPDRRGRWAQGLSRGDHVGLSADHRADLHCAPDPQQPGVRVVEGPQGDPARHQGDLPRRASAR
jgi:putative transposase